MSLREDSKMSNKRPQRLIAVRKNTDFSMYDVEKNVSTNDATADAVSGIAKAFSSFKLSHIDEGSDS